MEYTLSQQMSVEPLIATFNKCFSKSESTFLKAGAKEPFYCASDPSCREIQFCGDSFASALHEIAHWLVAGTERRKKNDYGYWYIPKDRSALQQQHFEEVEALNQSLEWILSSACRMKFHVSFDNLQHGAGDLQRFRELVLLKALNRLEKPFSPRTETFLHSLWSFYDSKNDFEDYWNERRQTRALPDY